MRMSRGVAVLCLGAAWIAWQPNERCSAQEPAGAPPAPATQPALPAGLPPGVSDVVKLARAGVKEEVILAKVKKDGVSYNLTTDQIIGLSDAGISQAIIAALLQSKPDAGAQPASAPAQPAAAPMPATLEPPPVEAAGPGSAAPAPPAVSAAPVAPAAAPALPPPAAPVFAPAPAAPPAPIPWTAAPAPAPAAAGFQDRFFADTGFNPALWTARSGLISMLASAKGSIEAAPVLVFKPTGMQMSGADGSGRLAGIQSIAAYVAPFTLTATVSAEQDVGIPFEVSW